MTEQLFQNILLYIAIPSSAIFLIMTIMSFVGMDSTDGVEADFNGDLDNDSSPIQLFTLRNLISFLMGLSWGGLMIFEDFGKSQIYAILFGVIIGILIVCLNLLFIYLSSKLHSPHITDMKSIIGNTATVYLTIPIQGDNKIGSISVILDGALKQLNAITNDNLPIPTGSIVDIVDILDNDIVVVTKNKILN